MAKYIFEDILLFFSLKKITEHLKVHVYSMLIAQVLYIKKKTYILFAHLNANLK